MLLDFSFIFVLNGMQYHILVIPNWVKLLLHTIKMTSLLLRVPADNAIVTICIFSVVEGHTDVISCWTSLYICTIGFALNSGFNQINGNKCFNKFMYVHI